MPFQVRRRLRRGHDRRTPFAALGPGTFVAAGSQFHGAEWISIGANSRIHPRAFFSVVGHHSGIKYQPSLTIGDRVTIGYDAVIACCGTIEIEDDVLTADRIFIGDTYHDYRDVSRPVSEQPLAAPRPVRIARGAFLGIGSAIMPGVTVGVGAYVGAGAVVTKDVPDHAVVVGNPAHVIRRWDGSAWVDGATP
jgi:acetyltransferase-like isoleucine patch superfamily enzyme